MRSDPSAMTGLLSGNSAESTTSVLRFIEDNWQLGRIDSLDNPDGNPAPGQGSFDRIAGSLAGLFEFGPPVHRDDPPLILDDNFGEVVQPGTSHS